MRSFLVILLAALLTSAAQAQTYEVDRAHSNVTFQISHAGRTEEGKFTDFSGNLTLDGAKSKVDMVVQAKSVDTHMRPRDQSLRGHDYFDVEKFPTLEFHSGAVKVADSGDRLEVTGNLTIKATTRTVTVPVTLTSEGTNRRFDCQFSVDRKDYGVFSGSLLENLLGDQVQIHMAILAIPRKTP